MKLESTAALQKYFSDPTRGLALLFVVVCLSRIYFLDAGYGVNVDAWRVARTARDIATTGNYSVSRFPGYPVQEIACSWFWRGGPLALNGLTALLSAVATTAFAVSARKLGGRDWFLAGLALAATPIFFVSSVCSKDYIWALAFVMLSLHCVLSRRAVLAGLFLGLATGCRLTSLAMILPLGLLLSAGRFDSWRIAIRFGLTTMFVSALAFCPVWLRYGTGFLTFYNSHARPDWLTIFNRGSVEIWGGLGLAGLILAVIGLRWSQLNKTRSAATIAIALSLTIVIYGVAYLRLPDQAGYLLPIVPAILLGLCLFCRTTLFRVACACLLLSPWIGIAHNGFTSGAIFADRTERLQTMISIRNFVMFAESLPGENTFVVGGWEPLIAVMAPQLSLGRNRYAYVLSERDVADTIQANRQIYYSSLLIRQFNFRVTGIDLAQFGGQDLRALHERFVTAHAVP